MGWDDVIGQEEAKQRLIKMAAENRVPQTMLFTGPAGSGKMALAMAFAAHLLLQGTEQNPARRRNVLAMLGNLEHPDLIFSYPTIRTPSMSPEHKPVSDDFAREWRGIVKKSPYFTLEQWMTTIGTANQQSLITAGESDELNRKLALKSSQGGYKVSIIWLAEKMNAVCANKILKLIEEPPSQTVFMLVCEHPEQLLDTILSRTQRFEVKAIAEEDIREALISRRGIDADAARRLARVAHGSWTRALESLNTGNENREFLDMFIMLMRLAYMRNVKDLKRWAEAVAAFGREKQRRMLTYFQHMVRENFVLNFRRPELNYMTLEEENFSRKFSRFINEANVIGINQLLETANRDIGQNANAKVVFFDLSLKMIVLLLKK